ncbi:unnamed protein product [Urochloa decumbens]|uniref:Uncharacterized protein n=1 Tax=Urochloa decumbens TaxID=240449 RepID=A0ABC9GGA7_9POAL
MEGSGLQESLPRRSLGVDHESLQQPHSDPMRKGGWITFPFLGVAMMGLGVAMSGALSNLVVYLIKEYNVPSVDAAQIGNIISGCLSLAPVAGAIVADAFFGCYPVVAISMAFSILSLVVFTLTASLRGLRPAACQPPPGHCSPASAGQMAALYAGVFLMCVSAAGSRFNQATMGADQFDAAADRDVLFNWFFIFLYASSVLASTVIVYVQDTVSWTLGFAVSAAAAVVGLAALLAGTRYYRRPAVRGSPFTGLARVAVAAARKRKVSVDTSGELKFHHGRPRSGHGDDKDGNSEADLLAPSDSFSFLNRAALITDGDVVAADGSVARPWRVCTVQEVEDFKAVLRILPLWTAAIFLSVAIGVQLNFTILQALVMDRAVGGGGFTVPAGSMIVGSLLAVVVSLGLLDRVLLPLWRRATGHDPTPLQRIGAGHVITVASMAASAVIERRRRATAGSHGEEGNPAWVSPMSAMWLLLPFALSGAGEALHFPGQVTLYYQEFPPSLKNTATGMVAMIVALGFYLSTALIGVVRRATTWLPDNMNASRLENLYWLLTVLVAVNFGYFMLCARLYKYQNIGK